MSVYSKTPRRIMALWFPRLPTDRLQRREQAQKASALEAPPLVLVAKVDNALRLSAVDRKATALGLTIGQPLANARAMLPELKVVAANDPADLKLLTRIADWCDRFTPFVALDGPRHLLLDVTGVSHLFGGEQAMLDRIRNESCRPKASRCAVPWLELLRQHALWRAIGMVLLLLLAKKNRR